MTNLHPFICSVAECEEYVGSDKLTPVKWRGLTMTVPICDEHVMLAEMNTMSLSEALNS